MTTARNRTITFADDSCNYLISFTFLGDAIMKVEFKHNGVVGTDNSDTNVYDLFEVLTAGNIPIADIVPYLDLVPTTK